MNVIDFIIRAEGGEIESEAEFIEGVQAIVDQGIHHSLQGSWQKIIGQLIASGEVTQ